MSVLALNAVFSHSKSHGVARLVLLAIADRADDAGRAYPGTTDICLRTNCSRRAVISARQELVAIGELVVERGGGISEEGRLSNRYRINLPPVQPVHPCADHTSADQAPTGARPAPEPVQTPHPNHQKPSKNHQYAKPQRFDAGSVDLPFSSAAFLKAWDTWIRHRREKRQALTPRATRLQRSKLLAMGEARAITAIQHSVSGNYQGIFETRDAEKPRSSPTGDPVNEAARRRAASKPKFSFIGLPSSPPKKPHRRARRIHRATRFLVCGAPPQRGPGMSSSHPPMCNLPERSGDRPNHRVNKRRDPL